MKCKNYEAPQGGFFSTVMLLPFPYSKQEETNVRIIIMEQHKQPEQSERFL
jgi:hypothetical protein